MKHLKVIVCWALLLCMTMAFAQAQNATDVTPMSIPLYLGEENAVMEYVDYVSMFPAHVYKGDDIVISGEDMNALSQAVYHDVEGQTGVSVKISTDFTPTIAFHAPQSGFYQMTLNWLQIEGRSIPVTLGILVNGETPYAEADQLCLSRVWTNAGETIRDIHGNDIAPTQIEVPIWQTTTLYDHLGYTSAPLTFFFHEGENTITICTKDESFMLHRLILSAPKQLPDYADILIDYEKNGYQLANAAPIIIEGEDALYKSSATLAPTADRSTPSTQPYESGKIRLNMIGGTNWAYNGEFLEWSFYVQESGLYSFNIKARQHFTSGVVSNRRIYLDDKVPFREADCVKFGYQTAWQRQTPTTSGGIPCLFYLEKGTHRLKLEVQLGEMGTILREVLDILDALNTIYREIIIITGTAPSSIRDYKLDQYIPDTIENISVQEQRLRNVIANLAVITGSNHNEAIGTLTTIATQMASMYKEPHQIPKKLSFFKTNIGSLGTWLHENTQQPLEIDYIAFCGVDNNLPETNADFLEKAGFDLTNFGLSFVTDYDEIGNLSTDEKAEHITVWISSGRDQMRILKSLVNDTFTPNHDVSVSLQLVDHNTLIPATMAGRGPDVALNCGAQEPVNYALRGASYDLSSFDDFAQVKARFAPELFVPYQFNGGCYALPETQNFNVLFYRADILREIGLDIPRTWKEVIAAISILNKHNMEFCLSSAIDVSKYYMFLMQLGGHVYNDALDASALNSDAAIEAFKMWTNFYLNYAVEQEIDFVNRFRTGEAPLGIASFTTYNHLSVSAPEIQGTWGFTLIPGTVDADGVMNRQTHLSGSAAMILSNTKAPEASWEFLKWWMSNETQTRFSREMESVLGESARYNTANTESFCRLPWTTAELQVLNEQLNNAKGVEEIPGSYAVSRHILNAFRRTVNHAADAKETLLDYAYVINNDIMLKRQEFGLPTHK